MHADEEKKKSEFLICVNLRDLRAIPDSVAPGRAALFESFRGHFIVFNPAAACLHFAFRILHFP